MAVGVLPLAAATPGELERLEYNHPGLVVDLGVGLWAWPLPMDFDDDGDLDLVVSCPDAPYNGTYLFENPGDAATPESSSAMPVFRPGRLIGEGLKNVTVSHIDGKARVLAPGAEVTNFRQGDLQQRSPIYPRSSLAAVDARIRANQWSYADFDGDGLTDLLVGQGLWSDYGWDDAFDESGNWTRGPLHGQVLWIRNTGSPQLPEYGEPERIHAAGEPIDVFGMPSPNLADFDGDGDLDLLCGEFLDGFTYFSNVGTRTEPQFAHGVRLSNGNDEVEMPLCMIVVSAVDWNDDGHVDLVVGQEDGRVALVRHTGKVDDGVPIFEQPEFFRQQAKEIKFGALVTPVSFDWDGDGDQDLVCGNTAGEIGWFENLDGGSPPKWSAVKLLKAGGETIRIEAGANGSIQGPAEAKWGYTTIDVADWDHDGLPDILANSIWGRVVWFRNLGTRTAPELRSSQPVTVQWPGMPPKPAWNWWSPTGNELVTQWRTTPVVNDWNRDGLNDLVMLDHEGYLALFERKRERGELKLLPGQRVFRGGSYDQRHREQSAESDLLRLNAGSAGKSGRRKIHIVDWDGDGRRDLLVNSTNVNLLRQVDAGDGTFKFVDEGPLSDRKLAGHTTSPTTVDWDGDGRPRLLVGAEDGYLYIAPSDSRRN